QVLDGDAVFVAANDAGQIVDAELRVPRAERDVGDIDLQLVRVARHADRGVDLVDHLRHAHAGGADRLAVEVERAVSDANLADVDRPAALRLRGIGRLRL